MNQSSSSSKLHYQKSLTSAWQQDSTMQDKKNNRYHHHQQLQQPRSRNGKPFQDLNNGGGGTGTSDNRSNASSSSFSSVEAPKGCLRFFLSHSSSTKPPFCSNSSSSNSNNQRPSRVKLISTPKSAPNMRPAKDNNNSSKRSIFHKPISQKFEKVKRNPPKSGRNIGKPSLSNVTSLKLSSGLNSSGSSENKMKSGFRDVRQLVVDKVSDFDALNLTPLNKVTAGCGLNLAVDCKVVNDDDDSDEKLNTVNKTKTNSTGSHTKTPPVQASVSPEIQCGSSKVSTAAETITPVCYGAGYVVSGVTDRRKCRPRGILTVGEAKPLDCLDSDYDSEKENTPGPVNSSGGSSLPLPKEASMCWLLSPCNEEDGDHKRPSGKDSCRFQRLKESAVHNVPATLSSGDNVFSPDLLNNRTGRSGSTASDRRKTRNPLLSPRGLTGSPLSDSTATAVLCAGKQRKNCSGLDKEKSPFSVDSLGSGNLIQTPQSDDSSMDRRASISWLNADYGRKNYNFDCELNSVAENLQMASLSPRSHVSIWDPISSSFQFDCLTSPSNSIDLSNFQKILDDRASWFSNSTMENVSQSQMRISWREGLVSRIFEMDEFDSCRCLSDEEDDANANGCKDDSLKFQRSPDLNVHTVVEQTSTNGSECKISIDSGGKINAKAKDEFATQVQCSCAESISTDGGGLIRSEDSDWTLCYKNQLFQL